MRKPYREEEIFDAMSKHLGARFVYEKDFSVSPDLPAPERLTADDFAGLPVEWRKQVRLAASQADGDIIAGLTEQLGDDHANLSTSLTDLAHQFRFADIINASAERPIPRRETA